MNRYENKVVLITGAGDIALATAERLLDEGAKVALSDFSPKALATAKQALQDKGYDPETVLEVPCNVTKLADCENVVSEVLKKWGKIDVEVITAGIIRHLPIDEMTEKDWQDVIDVNLTGVFNSMKAVVPTMKEKKYGHIVVISSIGGRTGRPGVGVNYAASKAGVNGMVINLAYNLAPYGITVNSIAPGPVKGKMFQSMTPENQTKLQNGIPLGRLGELKEIAGSIAYLSSDDAGWTTGEVLDVNGGLQY